MPAAQAQSSLIDDAEFLEQLVKVEYRPVATARKPEVVELDPLPDTMLDEEAAWRSRPTFTEPDPVATGDIPTRQIVLHVAAFLLMMCLGAAAAAWVFHDRVAQLLR